MSNHPTRGDASRPRKVPVDFEDLEWILQRIEEVEAHAEAAKNRTDSIAASAFQLRHQVRAMMRPEGL